MSESIGLGQIALDAEDIYWVEMRPSEGGRHVIVRRTLEGQVSDVTPAPYNVRTRVHENGGGAFTVSNGVVYFSNFSDQRLYRQGPGQQPHPMTPEGDIRYADAVIDPARRRIICVREDHTVSGREPVNCVVRLGVNSNQQVQVLASGRDFYAAPRLSPDGKMLAWLAWDHPNMPWDGNGPWVAPINDDGTLENGTLVAGGVIESIFQPAWSPDGVLYFVSDRGGWWNLYRWRNGEAEPLFPTEAEFGKPQWVFGSASYGFQSEQNIICTYNQHGVWRVGRLDTVAKELTTLDVPYSEMSRGDIKVADNKVVFEAGSSTEPMSLLQLDLDTGKIEVLRRSSSVGLDLGLCLNPRPSSFPPRTVLQLTHFITHPRTGLCRPAGREAAVAGQESRGTYRGHVRRPRLAKSILDQPGFCRAGRELRRQHRIWEGVPGTAQGQLEHRGC